MTSEEFPTEKLCLQSHAAELDTAIANSFNLYPMDPATAAALAPDTIGLFTIGLPGEDASFVHESECGRKEALRDYRYYAGLLYKGKTVFNNVLTEEVNVKRTKVKNTAQLRQTTIEVPLTGAELHSWIVGLTDTVTDGLSRSEVMAPILPRLQLLYHRESPSVWDEEELTIDEVPAADLEELFAPDVVPDGLTYIEVADRLREAGRIDLSPETLRARLDNFVALAQFDLPLAALEALTGFARTGGQRAKKAKQLAEHYESLFAGNDILAKQEAVHAIVSEMRASVPAIKNKQLKQVVGLTAARLRGAAINLDEFLMFFSNAYDNLGYERPEFLDVWFNGPEQEAVPPVAPVVVAVAAEVVVDLDSTDRDPEELEPEIVVLEEAPLDPAVIARIAAWEQSLGQEADRVFGAWRMTNSTRKPYTAVIRELENGIRNALGNQIMTPVIRDHAVELLAVMVRLDAMAAKWESAEVVTRVQSAIASQHEVARAAASFRSYAKEAGFNGPLTTPTAVDVQRSVRLIADNWPAFTELIRRAWPAGAAPTVVARLAPLMPSFATPTP